MLRLGVLLGVDRHDAVLVEKLGVALADDDEALASVETGVILDEGAAVGERVAALLLGDVDRLEHSLARLHVPSGLVEVLHSGLVEELELGGVRAGFVGAADELLLLLGYRRYRFDDGLALDARGVVSGADEDEVVVHNLAAVYAVALGLELVFLRRGVRQDDVDVAVASELKSLARSDRDPLHVDAGVLEADRREIVEQSGVVGARRRRHTENGRLVGRGRERGESQHADREQQRD